MRNVVSLLAMVSLVLLGGVASSWTETAHLQAAETPTEVVEITEVAEAVVSDSRADAGVVAHYDRPAEAEASALAASSPPTRPPR